MTEIRTTLNRILFLLIAVVFFVNNISATIPAGYYYQVKNKKGAALKTALSENCQPIYELDYGSGLGFTWEGFYYTDRNADNSVIDMYSDSVRYFNGFSSISDMHIEHSFPKSWWGGHVNAAYKDLFHLYPADGITNSAKNNWPLGEVTGEPWFYNGKSSIGTNGFGSEYMGNCFEPADEFKGDFARSYFYISTIYENLYPLFDSPMLDNNKYPLWKPWAIDLLMKWNNQDPVSDKEKTRIEAVYNIQGNRNPFIDYPELANYIWGSDTAKVFTFPEETEPFLITPKRGVKIDMGVILTQNTTTQQLQIKGANLNANLQLSFLHNQPTFKISSNEIPFTSGITEAEVTLSFSPTAGGTMRDTLLITGGGLSDTLRIPVKAMASTDFILLEPTEVTPVGGVLHWIADPFATQYRLNFYQGDLAAGDLIISTYVEGSSWNKAIEIYNGTGKTIDLSKYSVRRQSNGAGSFKSNVPLSGQLESGKSYVAVAKSCTTQALIDKAQILSDSIVSFNGNDAVALLRNGIIIDMVGIENGGESVYWGQDLTFVRKTSVTHPCTVFNENEWVKYPVDTYDMLGSHTMDFVAEKKYILENVFTGTSNSYDITGLEPSNTYTYSVESMRSGVIVPSVNTMQLKTAALEPPIVLDPAEIGTTSFKAIWEQSPYADSYLLNVFELTGQADTTETETFASVGTSGTPLPDGWAGNASGNYTSTTSSGIAPPSIGLKNNKEWLQTKTYPQPVTKFTCMYKWASAGTGSSMSIYGINNNIPLRIDSIVYQNTSKAYPVYNFTKDQNFTAFRFIYYKTSGNMSIDDVSSTYGSQDTTYILKNQPVTGEEYKVENLTENSTYYYNVRSVLNNSVSVLSENMHVRTLIESGVKTLSNSSYKIAPFVNSVKITGLQGNENISVYNISGLCIHRQKANSNEITIPVQGKGVYILNIRNSSNNISSKVLLF